MGTEISRQIVIEQMDETARFLATQAVPTYVAPYEGLGSWDRINTPSLRQRQDAFLERFLCSGRAAPADLEAARYWRSGAH